MRRYFLRAAAIAGTGYAAAFGITLRRTKGDARRAFIRMQLAHYKLLSILMFDHDPLSLVKNSSYPKFHDIPLTLQQRVAAWFLDLDKQKPDGVTLGDVYRLIGENGGENNKPCTLKEVLEEVQKRYLLLGSAAERDIFHRHLEVESAEAFRNYYNVRKPVS